MARRQVHEREQCEHGDEREDGRHEDVLCPEAIINRREHKGLIQAAEQPKRAQAQSDDGRGKAEATVFDLGGVEERLDGAQGDVEEGEEGVVDHGGDNAGGEDLPDGQGLGLGLNGRRVISLAAGG